MRETGSMPNVAAVVGALRSSGLIPPDGPGEPDPLEAAVDYSYL